MNFQASIAKGLLLAATLVATGLGAACPIDPAAPGNALLTIQVGSEAPVRMSASELARLPERRLTQRRTVQAAGADGAPAVEQSVVYSGVLLRDLIASLPSYAQRGREQRAMVFEAVATDDYRAVFSWGELFNGGGGEQALVIQQQNGQALNVQEGPLALRALGDVRPGPRHVRNLCGIIVHEPRGLTR